LRREFIEFIWKRRGGKRERESRGGEGGEKSRSSEEGLRGGE
jgi:hypothetical protein